MSLINICRENTDRFYRYKMPPIESKIEGKGNGIKTNIVNAAEVARALNRPPSYVIKYFGFELGAQTSINDDKEKYLVNGQHEASKLQDSLDGFINKFVLCPSCKNPETQIVVTKDGNLQKECGACGQTNKIDPRLKLNTYILKHPPKKDKKSKKSAVAQQNVVGAGQSISDIASGKKSADGDDSTDGVAKTVKVNDDDWAVDVSEEAVKARAQELDALTLVENEKYEEFGNWLLENGAETDKENLPSDVEIYKKASDLKIIDDTKTVEVLVQCIFDENIAEQIVEHKGLLGKLLKTEKHEKSFLGGIERLIGLQHPDLIKSVPKILMILYDNDLVQEDVIQDWGTHVSKKFVPKDVSKKVRRAAKPFLKWLEEAEEDEEDEESDEE